jgi:hypothetical protein
VLEPGADVGASDGEVVGKVAHVLAVPEEDVFDGIVIDTQTGPGGMRFVDAPEVEEIYERAVLIKQTAAEAENLPEPQRAPGVIENHGVEDTEGALTAKLHRAWDRISGNY